MTILRRIRALATPRVALVAASVTGGGVLLGARTAHAGIADFTTTLVARFVLWVVSILLYLVGGVMDLTARMLTWIVGMTSFENVPIVDVGWRISLDFVNLFFILILLFIGFATIFRQETYGIKALLPRLIVVALLINFSKVIAGFILDIGNLLTYFFLNPTLDANGNSTLGTSIMNLLNLQKAFDGNNSLLKDNSVEAEAALPLILGGIASVMVSMIAAWGLLFYAGVFIVRIVWIWILIIAAPFAWIFSILPGTRRYWNQWWDEFLCWTFIAPVMVFFLFLLAALAQEAGSFGLVGFVAQQSPGLKSAKYCLNAFLCDIRFLMQYFVVLTFIYAGPFFAKRMSCAGGAAAIGMASAATNWAAGTFSGYNAAGRAVDRTKAGFKKAWDDTRPRSRLNELGQDAGLIASKVRSKGYLTEERKAEAKAKIQNFEETRRKKLIDNHVEGYNYKTVDELEKMAKEYEDAKKAGKKTPINADQYAATQKILLGNTENWDTKQVELFEQYKKEHIAGGKELKTTDSDAFRARALKEVNRTKQDMRYRLESYQSTGDEKSFLRSESHGQAKLDAEAVRKAELAKRRQTPQDLEDERWEKDLKDEVAKAYDGEKKLRADWFRSQKLEWKRAASDKDSNLTNEQQFEKELEELEREKKELLDGKIKKEPDGKPVVDPQTGKVVYEEGKEGLTQIFAKYNEEQEEAVKRAVAQKEDQIKIKEGASRKLTAEEERAVRDGYIDENGVEVKGVLRERAEQFKQTFLDQKMHEVRGGDLNTALAAAKTAKGGADLTQEEREAVIADVRARGGKLGLKQELLDRGMGRRQQLEEHKKGWEETEKEEKAKVEAEKEAERSATEAVKERSKDLAQSVGDAKKKVGEFNQEVDKLSASFELLNEKISSGVLGGMSEQDLSAAHASVEAVEVNAKAGRKSAARMADQLEEQHAELERDPKAADAEKKRVAKALAAADRTHEEYIKLHLKAEAARATIEAEKNSRQSSSTGSSGPTPPPAPSYGGPASAASASAAPSTGNVDASAPTATKGLVVDKDGKPVYFKDNADGSLSVVDGEKSEGAWESPDGNAVESALADTWETHNSERATKIPRRVSGI